MWLPLSPTPWVQLQFSFSIAVQSHSKAMKGYELVSTPTKSHKKRLCTNIDINTCDKYRLTEISPHKSSCPLACRLSLQVIEHLLRTADDSALRSSICEALYSAVENSIIYRAAHHQLRVSLPTFSLDFHLSPFSSTTAISVLEFQMHVSDSMTKTTNLKLKKSLDMSRVWLVHFSCPAIQYWPHIYGQSFSSPPMKFSMVVSNAFIHRPSIKTLNIYISGSLILARLKHLDWLEVSWSDLGSKPTSL